MGSNETDFSGSIQDMILVQNTSLSEENSTEYDASLQIQTEILMSTNMSSVHDDLNLLKQNMDVFFLLVMGIIIFLMQGGFAFLEAGSVRSKNTTNILIKNLLDVFICGLVYWIVGYPLAYGEGNYFIGYTGWASYGLSADEYASWFFQFVFAATTATIVSGTMAERCEFCAYLIYSAVLSGFVYPIVSHWAWSSSGWLANGYYHDFAGSGVVHLTGGVAGLVGCVCLGPRIERFGPNGKRIEGHSLPLAALGGFILLFGFLAFNGGSQGAISGQGDAEAIATAIINTVISGSAAGLFVLVVKRFIPFSRNGTWSFTLTLNGALTGMVSACAGCNLLYPWASFITGIIAAPVYLGISGLMDLFKVDDPLDAVAVHAGGGLWGLIAAALFRPDGIVYGGVHAGQMIGWNLAGALAIILWTGAISIVMFGTLKYIGKLRVPKDVEIKGLDLAKHGEAAYPAEAWSEDQYIQNNNNNNNNNNNINLPPVMCVNKNVTPSSFPRTQFRELKSQTPVMCSNANAMPSSLPRAQFRELKEQISLKILKRSSQANTPTSFSNEGYKFDTDTEIITRNLPENETT